MSVHGPWQIAPTGLPARKMSCTNATHVRVGAQLVGVHGAAGHSSAS